MTSYAERFDRAMAEVVRRVGSGELTAESAIRALVYADWWPPELVVSRQRFEDVQAEQAKQLAAWDRQRERMAAEIAELRRHLPTGVVVPRA